MSHVSAPSTPPRQMPVIHIWSVCTSRCLCLSSHPHTLTSSSLSNPPICTPTPYSGLRSTLSRSFALLISSSPTVFHPSLLSSCVLDKCLCCLHFHHCETNRIRGGCDSPFISPPSLVCYRTVWIPSVPFFCFVLFCLFRRSFLRSIAPSILVKSITSLLPVALFFSSSCVPPSQSSFKDFWWWPK